MSSSPVSEQRPTGDNQPAEADIRSNAGQAARLYQRGVAAARGGQRRVAAGFLTRSVKLDPQNESAWLWLSGVLDDPHQVAFCLNSVLKINPANERAQRGLRWLEERQLLTKRPTTRTPLMDVQVGEPETQREARERGESWWVNWRQWRQESRRVALMWWGIPLIILGLALALHQSFAMAIEQTNRERMALEQIPTSVAAPTATVVPAPMVPSGPIFDAEPGTIRASQVVLYLDRIEPLREKLRAAVETYRESMGQPGRGLSHITAAQAFRTSVEEARLAMQAITPPADLQAAHAAYLRGLEVEIGAINDLLEFYSSYRVELANRAALRFQEANSHFDTARQFFNEELQQIKQESNVSVHTIR